MAHRIAFSGLAGAGKSTFRDALVAQGFRPISIAEPIKVLGDAVADALGIPKTKFARRKIYQAIGRGGRTITPTYWLDQLIAREHLDGDFDDRGVVLDDVRFPNEANLLRDLCGFTIVQVTCPTDERIRRMAHRDGGVQLTDLQDSTEQEVDAITPDLVLPNATEADRERSLLRLATLIAHG